LKTEHAQYLGRNEAKWLRAFVNGCVQLHVAVAIKVHDHDHDHDPRPFN
jgi:hypothetical protein